MVVVSQPGFRNGDKVEFALLNVIAYKQYFASKWFDIDYNKLSLVHVCIQIQFSPELALRCCYDICRAVRWVVDVQSLERLFFVSDCLIDSRVSL